jgi:hypothetical protein
MKSEEREKPKELSRMSEPSGPIADLVLTLPMFIGYHLGVIFLPVRNAADVVTRELVALADHDMAAYGGLTLGIGLVFVVVLGLAGRGHALRWQRFAAIALEGVVYAVAMRLAAAYVVGKVFLGPPEIVSSPFAGLVMSFGAGFYEEIAFRVVLFGLGFRALLFLFPITVPLKRVLLATGWAAVAAAVFSGWHYVGSMGDPFDPRSFVFRWVCGMVFTTIFALRGFAPAVWTHTVYDVWVLVF